MDDLIERFRELDDVEAPDVWGDATSRPPHLPRGPSAGRKALIAAIAFGLSAAALSFAFIALRLEDEPSATIGSTPSAPAVGATIKCSFPPFRPTYLPWLAPGELVPDPEPNSIERKAPSDAPVYAILTWKYGNVRYEGGPELKGTVTLWRTTEPPTDLPIDPNVPGLPGGSPEGAIHSPPGDPDWGIVWLDTAAGEYGDDCAYTTLVVNLPNLPAAQVKDEALLVAASLVAQEGTDLPVRSPSMGSTTGPPPAGGPFTAPGCPTQGPWSDPDCPQRQWMEAVITAAGYVVTDDTGSALVARAGTKTFYAWNTGESRVTEDELADEGYTLWGRYGETEVFFDGVRYTWPTALVDVWISTEGIYDELPDATIETLVQSSVETAFPS